jgi:uncharacterized membrane protein
LSTTPDDPHPTQAERKARKAANLDTLVVIIVYVALGLIAYVVVVGGIVCVLDNGYAFSQYVSDLRQMYKWLLAAAVLVAIKLMLPQFRVERRQRNGEDR